MIRWLDSTACVTVSSADCTRAMHLRRARMAGDPGEVELQRGERAADVVVDLARDRRALVLDAGLQVLGELVQALLRGDQVAVGLDAGAPRLGRVDRVQQRRHQTREVVLLQVVAGAVAHRLDRGVLADLARDQDERARRARSPSAARARPGRRSPAGCSRRRPTSQGSSSASRNAASESTRRVCAVQPAARAGAPAAARGRAPSPRGGGRERRGPGSADGMAASMPRRPVVGRRETFSVRLKVTNRTTRAASASTPAATVAGVRRRRPAAASAPPAASAPRAGPTSRRRARAARRRRRRRAAPSGDGFQLNSNTQRASAQLTAIAASDASTPASAPTPSSSARCTCASSLPLAPSARITANSRARASRVALTAANSTTRPAARVKPNRNSTARTTWSSTPWICAIDAETSIEVMFGKSRLTALSKPATSGARKAAM